MLDIQWSCPFLSGPYPHKAQSISGFSLTGLLSSEKNQSLPLIVYILWPRQLPVIIMITLLNRAYPSTVDTL